MRQWNTKHRNRSQFSVRSSVETAKQALIEKLKALTALAGGYCEVRGDYPGWEYRVESPLRDKMVAVYRELYGKEPAIEGNPCRIGMRPFRKQN